MKIFFRGKWLTSLNVMGIGVLFVAFLLGACNLPIRPTTAPDANSSTTTAAQATTPTEVPNEESSAEAQPSSGTVTATQQTTTTEAVAVDTSTGKPETFKGIPVGFTAEGLPYRGSLDAPITLYEYSDYQCPFCSRYFVQTEPAIDESYVRSGQVRVVFRDFPLVELHPNAPPAHFAALCVADQGAALYWAIHSRLFQTQSEWNQLPDPAPYFADLATEIGADMDQYNACVESGEKEAIVEARVAEAQAKGFNGTPSFQFVREATDETFDLIGAQPYDQFAGMIDTLVAGGTPQTEQQAQGADNNEIPVWATADGLKPDPEHPGLTMAGDFYRGNPDAKVVIIEFSDFQCPFCRKHTLETQPTLDEQFVATDQVMWVFKHFPLTIHPQAPAAAVASECASDQGKFWEMHHLLFTSTQSWSIDDPTPVFTELAQQLELDVEQFSTCLKDASVAQRVQDDMAAGAPFVRGTPTFIVLSNGQGSIIPGALPAERFSSIIQEVLTGAGQ